MSAWTKDYFWGCQLTEANKSVHWDEENLPEDEETNGKDSKEDEEDDEDFLKHSLFAKQVVLGVGAVAAQRNVIAVETKDFHGKKITQIIASLTLGQCDQCTIDVGFHAPTTFKLVEGNGPVHISGAHIVEVPYEDRMDDSMMDEFVMEEEAESPSKYKLSKKRKAAKTPPGSKRKVVKLEGGDNQVTVENEDEDEDEEMEDGDEDESATAEDEEEEEESEEEEVKPIVKKGKGRPKAATKVETVGAKKEKEAKNGVQAGKKVTKKAKKVK
ncbi:PREDICTED: nucleoplasmin-like protein ANO39 isoform X2 [Priapulus caudatus]|uniref:Nucleoplasmin-like protein ANO39 isoform X2 n=1 Tax=Priapulus caudatus TaxID=37621 RepID=A0ABM1DP40_PRICU|nr:PREDICTED: nucleoplasmin-like protein ANO39 isoform X2 [Priapulus caudatus]